MLELGIYLGIILLVGIILILIPTSAWYTVFKIFSFGTGGIRYIRRRRDHTDTLANVFLFLSLILSLGYFIVPYFNIVTGVWLTFAFFATFGQAARVGKEMSMFKGKLVLLGVYLMYACGLCATIGLFNNFVVVSDVAFFNKAIFGGKFLDLLFYLQKPYTADILLQAVITFTSCYVLWAQFKYMRLEDTFKAKWIGTYLFKVLFVCAFLVGISYFGFDFIDKIYQVEATTA